MTNQFDFNPGRGVARPAQSGRNSGQFYKNCCLGCKKPFNRKKGRARTYKVIFTDGTAHYCEKCTIAALPGDDQPA